MLPSGGPNIAGCNIPIFLIGNTSEKSGSIFQLAMLVYWSVLSIESWFVNDASSCYKLELTATYHVMLAKTTSTLQWLVWKKP